jgi:hypothetical protein
MTPVSLKFDRAFFQADVESRSPPTPDGRDFAKSF